MTAILQMLFSNAFSSMKMFEFWFKFHIIFKCIFFNENVWILIKISLKFVPKGPIDNKSTLVQVMAWHRAGDKPLLEPVMA